jgi:hypothetical protein
MSEETLKEIQKRKNIKAKLNQCRSIQHKSTIQAQYSEKEREIKKLVKREKKGG